MISDKIKTLLKPQVDTEIKLLGLGLGVGTILDKFEDQIIQLEARQLQKGDKGDKGERGDAGKDGRDGKDGRNGIQGAKGAKGDTGPMGKQGLQGVSVVDAEVALDGNLVLKLSNGDEIDAGEIVQQVAKSTVIHSKQLANFQIIVSSTAPSNPSVNDLWYDIS